MSTSSVPAAASAAATTFPCNAVVAAGRGTPTVTNVLVRNPVVNFPAFR